MRVIETFKFVLALGMVVLLFGLVNVLALNIIGQILMSAIGFLLISLSGYVLSKNDYDKH
jgi:hypothetical protein